MEIKNCDIKNASSIMQEAAKWLIEKGMPLWKIEDLSEEALSNYEKLENIYVGFVNNEPVTAMILKWYDPVFWPDIKENDSGFIHKLSIKRKYAGQGYSKKMIQFAESECKRRGIK